MSIDRQSVWDCMRACEALLKADELGDLSEAEIQAIAHMVNHLSKKLLNDGES